METLFKNYYIILKKGGTLIIFYDHWKSKNLKDYAIKYSFKQPRVGMWVKSNPVPLNSKSNYLSNSIEYFYTFVKKGKPTFNSKYDRGIYNYPLCHGRERLNHPTQKPLELIKDLINKHSNIGDIILDTFAGTGTTAQGCIDLNRDYIMIESNEKYFDMMNKRLNKI